MTLSLLATGACARAGVLEHDGGRWSGLVEAGEPDGAADASLDAEAGGPLPGDVPADGSVPAAPGDSDGATEAPPDAGRDAAASSDAGQDAASGDDAGSSDAATPNKDCVPGTYTGTFEGQLSINLGVQIPLFPISGEIEIVATTSDSGDQLTIDNGSISGADQDGNPVSADVEGVMDCTTFKLQDGRLLNGVYTRQALNQTVEFEGTIEADYIPGVEPRVVGSWATDGGFEMGEGTFEAQLSEPAP